MTDGNPHLEHASPRKKSLWRRWMDWSGSFFILSLLFHILLIVLATLLIVQVINNKPKLKFTAAPPIAAHPEEYHVKHSKKMASDAPAISKRITTTALNAQITLPSVDISTSTAPDVMDSVMSGLGASGLGAGAGAGGGIASMPMEGMTAFGFRGGGKQALVGHFYDFKQNQKHEPTAVQDDGSLVNQLLNFLGSGWDEESLARFYKSEVALSAVQIYIPVILSGEAPKSFQVEKEVQPRNWAAVYKGTVVAAKDTIFRFRGRGDNFLAVRFDTQNVFFNSLQDRLPENLFHGNQPLNPDRGTVSYGSWIQVHAGQSYPIEILLSDYGGTCSFILCLEERNPEKPYPPQPGDPKAFIYPLLQLKKNMPIPKHTASPDLFMQGCLPEVSTDQTIFVER